MSMFKGSNCILIVDGHGDFRKAVRRLLELKEVKLQLLEASTQAQAERLAMQWHPRIVIIDLFINGTDGMMLAGRIKSKQPSCFVIMLTMFRFIRKVRGFGQCSVDVFLNKDDVFQRLISVVSPNI